MGKIMFKTLAEFKREAKVGRYIKGGYYDKMESDEWREIRKTQSNGLWATITKNRQTASTIYPAEIANSKVLPSKNSFLQFPKASETKINDGVLEIYEQRAKYGENDIHANTSWLQFRIERGDIDTSEISYYQKLVAKYELGEE